MTSGPVSLERKPCGRRISEIARAKVNLTLEVLGRRADGYHQLASLVAFAGISDEFELVEASSWRLRCRGPMSGAIVGDNLVDRAARAVQSAWPSAATGHAELLKVLPVAAGIGGGSSDAAAALRALRRLNAATPGAPDWLLLARQLGADVPVCLANCLAFVRGVGEQIDPIDIQVVLPAVLVNPGVTLSTASVFADLAAPPLQPEADDAATPEFRDASHLLDWVSAGRNDLEAPALRLAPAVGRVRAALLASPGCRLTRLSGSGPTCFGLFETDMLAQAGASSIAHAHPDWWVRATVLS